MGTVGRVPSNFGDRAWGPSVYVPLHLLQLAAIFAAGHCGKLIVLPQILLNFRREGKKSRKGNV